MQDDPFRYWQDLTSHYRQMSDGELLQLAEKPEDLTDVAQQVLRDEMKLRGLSAVRSEPQPPNVKNAGAAIHLEPMSYKREFHSDHGDGSDAPQEYTWKTKLCECETRQQAWQLGEALRRAGIDSWIQNPVAKSDALDLTYPRIFVAADQLDQAQAIAGQPIPQDIIEESKELVEVDAPEYFEVPACPECGAEDPVLESADPVNVWACENCGAEWTHTAPGDGQADGQESSSG